MFKMKEQQAFNRGLKFSVFLTRVWVWFYVIFWSVFFSLNPENDTGAYGLHNSTQGMSLFAGIQDSEAEQ